MIKIEAETPLANESEHRPVVETHLQVDRVGIETLLPLPDLHLPTAMVTATSVGRHQQVLPDAGIPLQLCRLQLAQMVPLNSRRPILGAITLSLPLPLGLEEVVAVASRTIHLAISPVHHHVEGPMVGLVVVASTEEAHQLALAVLAVVQHPLVKISAAPATLHRPHIHVPSDSGTTYLTCQRKFQVVRSYQIYMTRARYSSWKRKHGGCARQSRRRKMRSVKSSESGMLWKETLALHRSESILQRRRCES